MKRTLLFIPVALLALVILLPFLWTVSTSLKPLTEVNRYPPEWTSPSMSLKPYRDMFFYLPFSRDTLNSLIVASSATALTLVVGSLAAFAFSRFRFAGRKYFLLLLLLSQMLPGAGRF